jgi:hypothetical protein
MKGLKNPLNRAAPFLLILALGLAAEPGPVTAQGKAKVDFTVKKATPASVDLTPGQGSKEIQIEGTNLDRVKAARLVLLDKDGKPVSEDLGKTLGKGTTSPVHATFSLPDAKDPKHLKVTVEATSTAKVGKYQLELLDKTGMLVVPVQLAVLDPSDVPAGFFSDRHPKLVVFIHGMSSFDGSLEDARDYWGFEFISATLGGKGDKLFTFDGTALDKNTWFNKNRGTGPTKEESDKAHFLSLTQDPRQSIPKGAKGVALPSNVWGLLTHRNGRLTIMEQAQKVIKQIYDLYTRQFPTVDKQPQIILVTHSMGGPIARINLSNPRGPVKCGVNRQKAITLSDDERRMADFLRNRTLCLITHAAPHEGSPLADAGVNLNNLRTGMNAAANSPGMQGLAAFLGFPAPDQVRTTVENEPMLAALVQEVNRDAVYDNGTVLLSALNQGELKPENAHRTDGSLIPLYCFGGRSPAGGFLDKPPPFYKSESDRLAAADPRIRQQVVGLIAFDLALKSVKPNNPWGSTSDPRLDKVRRVTFGQYVPEALAAAVQYWAMDQGVAQDVAQAAIDKAVTAIGGPLKFLGIGDVDPSKFAPTVMYLDQKWRPTVVAREITMTIGKKTVTVRVPDHLTLAAQDGTTVPDGEIDTDGMVPVNSSLGISLGFDHTSGGSWYRLVDGPWSLTNHGNVIRKAEVGAWVFQNLISRAGPKVGAGALSTYGP